MVNKVIKQIKEKIKDVKDEREKVSSAKTAKFAKKNRNCIVFLLDLRTDDMVAAYRDKYMAARIMSPYLHRKTKLAKTIVLGRGNTRKRDKDITRFGEFIKEFLWQISDKVGTPQENAKRQQEELSERSFGKKLINKVK